MIDGDSKLRIFFEVGKKVPTKAVVPPIEGKEKKRDFFLPHNLFYTTLPNRYTKSSAVFEETEAHKRKGLIQRLVTALHHHNRCSSRPIPLHINTTPN